MRPLGFSLRSNSAQGFVSLHTYHRNKQHTTCSVQPAALRQPAQKHETPLAHVRALQLQFVHGTCR